MFLQKPPSVLFQAPSHEYAVTNPFNEMIGGVFFGLKGRPSNLRSRWKNRFWVLSGWRVRFARKSKTTRRGKDTFLQKSTLFLLWHGAQNLRAPRLVC